MCGISGIVGVAVAEQHVRRMNDCLAHRGRDGHAVSKLRVRRSEVVGAFGHRRLSVLDLSAAADQPMERREGEMQIVFNGEIYNFQSLRDALEAEGVRFRTHSDTEVILEGWALHGASFISRLRGMFAFAIWDESAAQLVLVRDQFGIKPLYLARRAGAIAFASEVRALLAGGFGERTLSHDAVGAYLALGSIPEPLCAISGIEPLPPGAIRRFTLRDGSLIGEQTERFALPLEITDTPAITDVRDAARAVREALRESVRYHLVSDVPVGCFLSGGVDSSAVVALAAEAAGKRLETFTVVFEEAQFSEAAPARAVANRYGTRHQEIPLRGSDFLNALPAAFEAMDQPSLDGLNTFVVSRAVHEAGLKVVLSGLGGDELFGGYASFRRAWAARHWWRLTAPLRGVAGRAAAVTTNDRAAKAAQLFAEPDLALGAYRASRALFSGRRLVALAGGTSRIPVEEPPPGLSLLQRVSWYESTGYMRSVLLRDSDVFSMAHHLELRVPFVDRGVAAASLRISDALKMKGGAKGVLVEAVRDLLPREVWDRPKQGFALPFADWMRGPLAREIEVTLTASSLVERVGLRPRAVRDVWRAFQSGNGGMTWSRPWALYTLVRWATNAGVSIAAQREDLSLQRPATQAVWPAA